MSTSRFIDGKFAKLLVLVNGLVPAGLLAYDAYQGQLGVNEVNFAIRTTGLLGLIFLVLSLVITPLRRLTGWTTLIAPRRQLGLLGFFYIAAHFLIFWIYDRDGSIGDTFAEIIARSYLWFGFGALALMIPMAVTSTDGMVSRLGAKRWKRLHRLAYVAIPAGVVHYYMLQKSDTRLPIIVGVIVGVLLLTRFIPAKKPAPQRKQKRFWSGELKVVKIARETHDVKTFRFAMLDGSALPFEAIAGQYLNIALMIDGKRVNRSYTIASSPVSRSHCEITVKRIGLGSQFLHDRVNEGDTVKIGAPAGKFYFKGDEANQVTLVAGGVGITPMMSVIRTLTARNWKGEMYLLFSVRKPEDVIFEAELRGLAQQFPNLHVETVVTSVLGHITKDIVRAAIPDVTKGPVMLCGPEPMMDAMRAIFVELGVPNERVTQEEFKSPLQVVESSATGGLGGEAPVEISPTNGAAAVQFRKANKRVDAAELTILEAAEDCGVDIPFECRSGICGQCKTPLVSGKVNMDVQDALTAADRSKGLILACQARAATDEVVVDA
jgi:glycine betaine catabolism B